MTKGAQVQLGCARVGHKDPHTLNTHKNARERPPSHLKAYIHTLSLLPITTMPSEMFLDYFDTSETDFDIHLTRFFSGDRLYEM